MSQGPMHGAVSLSGLNQRYKQEIQRYVASGPPPTSNLSAVLKPSAVETLH